MVNQDLLDPPVNQNVTSGADNIAVRTALDLIQRAHNTKVEQDSRNLRIQDLLEAGFEVRSPRGPRKIHSRKIYQALWRTAGRMKPLDFSIHGKGRPEFMEKLVTAAVATVMDSGRFISSLRDKGGMFYKMLLYGDGFLYVGANPEEKGPPILFNPIGNANVYVDQFATGIRDQGWGRNATKMCVVFSYSWAEAVKLYPKLKKKGGLGRIPRDFSLGKEQERDFEQTTEIERDLVEIGYFYDIANKNYTVFAGTAVTVLEELKGDNYPFVLNGEAYIPILQWTAMPASEGFYNHGLGAMIYEIALESQRLFNMEIGHIEDNTYPIELVNVAQGEAAKFFNKLKLAYEQRALGQKAFVAMEQDPANGNQVSSQTLLTGNALGEWQLVMSMLDNEISRMGIQLDELGRDANVTATQILAEEENANAWVKQVMEYNASTMKFAVELTMDFIKEFVDVDDDTPLNLTTKIEIETEERDIETEDGVVTAEATVEEVSAETVTLGDIARELKENEYFVRVNARTGAIPTNVLQQAQISRVLPLAQPGSAGQIKLLTKLAELNDQDITGEELIQPPEPEAPPEGALPPGGEGDIPLGALEGLEEGLASGTDRLTINPRQAEQSPVL